MSRTSCRRVITRWSVVAGLALALAGTLASPAQAAGKLPEAVPGSGRVTSRLCGQATTVDHLVVRRVDAFPANGRHFSFPAEVIVTDQVLAVKAAEALCALPAMPAKALFCPADWGVTYRLSFSAQGYMFARVVVDATGCQSVTGLTPTRFASRTPEFWRRLGTAMGLRNPTWATFTGSGGPAG